MGCVIGNKQLLSILFVAFSLLNAVQVNAMIILDLVRITIPKRDQFIYAQITTFGVP
jgi:hypothetical protein